MHASSAGLQSPNRVLILDFWPIMEWLKDRNPVADRVALLLDSAKIGINRLLLSSINLGEIYYNCWKEWDEARADATLEMLRKHPIQVVHPTKEVVLRAARVKAQYAISYADAVVLAIEFGGSVLTGDREFLPLATDGVLNVDWIGA
jgi:predicted nucleic acid-binding protein